MNLRTKIEEGIEEPYKLKLKQIGEEFLIKATLERYSKYLASLEEGKGQ